MIRNRKVQSSAFMVYSSFKFEKEIRHVAIVGTGVIGTSWATLFLQKGLRVTATDITKDAEQRLRDGIHKNAPQLSQKLLHFEENLEDAVKDVQFVQENGPERKAFKQELFRDLDECTSPDVLLVSSSSGIIPTVFQERAMHPERILLGHPFNPPHLIPLVEVCGGEKTAPAAVIRTIEFYQSIGKKPIHLKKEMEGHVANRLQAALWQEAFYLVKEGVASIKDIDMAISEGPGLRWALLGPFMNLHLSGGEGGIRHVLEHLGPPLESWIKNLGTVSINEDLIRVLAEGVKDLLTEKNLTQLIAERDQLLQELKTLKGNTKEL